MIPKIAGANKYKTNIQKIQRLQKINFKVIIDKGVLQAGFQLLDIIRTKTAKGIDINSSDLHLIVQDILKN